MKDGFEAPALPLQSFLVGAVADAELSCDSITIFRPQEDLQVVLAEMVQCHVKKFLSERDAVADNAAMLVFDKDSMSRFQESFTALILHFFGFAAPQARVLGFEKDNPAYLKWVKETMLFIFLPVVEKAFNKLLMETALIQGKEEKKE